jgi:hypothetical protein
MKQETLEEAAANYLHRVADGKRTTGYADEDFIEGAKWQQERNCKHSYILTAEQSHRVIKCSKCNDTQTI